VGLVSKSRKRGKVSDTWYYKDPSGKHLLCGTTWVCGYYLKDTKAKHIDRISIIGEVEIKDGLLVIAGRHVSYGNPALSPSIYKDEYSYISQHHGARAVPSPGYIEPTGLALYAVLASGSEYEVITSGLVDN
jgi:hypothetical protein